MTKLMCSAVVALLISAGVAMGSESGYRGEVTVTCENPSANDLQSRTTIRFYHNQRIIQDVIADCYWDASHTLGFDLLALPTKIRIITRAQHEQGRKIEKWRCSKTSWMRGDRMTMKKDSMRCDMPGIPGTPFNGDHVESTFTLFRAEEN